MYTTPWKTSEIKLLREHYPSGGVDLCLKHLVRSAKAIQQQAFRHNIRAPHASEILRIRRGEEEF